MMKRGLFIIAMLCVLLFGDTSLFAFSDILSKAEREYLNKKKTIMFISQTHYPPFEFINKEGDHSGMCIELIRWIATELGFKAGFIDTSFKKAQEAVLSEEADVLTSFFYSKKRDRFFDFTRVIFTVPASIFVKARRPDIKDISDLSGKKIAMQAGDFAKEFLESKKIKCEYIFTTDFARATDLVISGDADAIIGDEQIVLYHIFSNNLTDKIKQVGSPLYTGKNCMAVKQDNTILVSILNKGIYLAKNSGTIKRINRKWLGVKYLPEKSFLSRYLPYILIVFFLLFIVISIIWFWNVRLRHEVKKSSEALSLSEKTLRAILSSSPIGIGLMENRKIVWYNKAMKEILGYEPHELKGKNTRILYPDDEEFKKASLNLKKALETGDKAAVETRWLRKDGTVFHCLLQYTIMDIDDERISALVLAEDITKRKEMDEKLRKSLREKEALLREIHHRVKNNMQIITSLLKIQSMYFNDKRILDMIRESQNRITSMSLIHEQLYRSGNLADIDCESYLRRLAGNLRASFGPGASRIELKIMVDEIKTGPDIAIPCGLIINELISNSFKHAFPQKSGGIISIIFRRADDKNLELIVEDNGIGISRDIDISHEKTLGLKLVKNLTEHQLSGYLEIKKDKGVQVKIRFPYSSYPRKSEKALS